MSYNDLLAKYPDEQWVEETDDKDGCCVVCDEREEPCRTRINEDVSDIRSELRRRNVSATGSQILEWLHARGYSTLTHSTHQLADEFLASRPNTEMLLFTFPISPHCPPAPVTLIRYGSGNVDLHLQTGPTHEAAIRRAATLLAQQGLQVEEKNASIAASGIYYRVTPMDDADLLTCGELRFAGAIQ